MKYELVVLLFCFALVACNENPPTIPPLGPQDVGDRKVLIEEFTGARCPNCPDGSAEIENLVALYGKNLVPVSIHSSGNFAIPLPDSKYDFRTEAGDQLLELLGQPLGYPSAVVNRILPEGETRMQQTQASWAGLIENALAEEPSVALNLELRFEPETRTLNTSGRILPNQNIEENLRLSVMLLEDHIIDPQLTREGLVENYDHRHVFRTMLTNAAGEQLGNSFKAGTAIDYRNSFVIPEDWVVENCQVVMFVHRVDEVKEVLQVEAAKVFE